MNNFPLPCLPAVLIALLLGLWASASPGLGAERESGPVIARRDGEIIENIRIHSKDRPAISILGKRNVIIRNVRIIHSGAPGIDCKHAPGLTLKGILVRHASGVPGGKNYNNIDCESSPGLKVSHAQLHRGASGIYLRDSPNATIRWLSGYDFLGGPPRGQLVQFNRSGRCRLEYFSVVNKPGASWPEDNISVYESDNCVIRKGLIDGNTSPSGVAVMFERSSNGLVEDVDAIHQGNGSFFGYPAQDVTFRRTRSRDNICRDQGRGKPLSNALIWAGGPGSKGLRIEKSRYFNPCNAANIIWHHAAFEFIEVETADFRPRAPVKVLLDVD